jgi:hypothetical protein
MEYGQKEPICKYDHERDKNKTESTMNNIEKRFRIWKRDKKNGPKEGYYCPSSTYKQRDSPCYPSKKSE